MQPELRAELLDVAASFRANVVDMGPETIVLEAVCSPGRLDSLLAQLDPHGTCELVRTGLIAIARGGGTITDEEPERWRLRIGQCRARLNGCARITYTQT